MPGGESPLTTRTDMVKIVYFPDPPGIYLLCVYYILVWQQPQAMRAWYLSVVRI